MSKKIDIKFHQNLGKLFYAIALADHCVRDEELHKLEDLLHTEWRFLDDYQDDFGTPAKASIISTFKWLRDNNDCNAEMCYDDFISYKRTHELLFDTKMKSLILKTAGIIAASFSGQNKSELIMLAKLCIEFKLQFRPLFTTLTTLNYRIDEFHSSHSVIHCGEIHILIIRHFALYSSSYAHRYVSVYIGECLKVTFWVSSGKTSMIISLVV